MISTRVKQQLNRHSSAALILEDPTINQRSQFFLRQSTNFRIRGLQEGTDHLSAAPWKLKRHQTLFVNQIRGQSLSEYEKPVCQLVYRSVWESFQKLFSKRYNFLLRTQDSQLLTVISLFQLQQDGTSTDLWPWAQVSQFPLIAFSHRVIAKDGQSRMSFLIVRLEWKFSRTCSPSETSDLGIAARDAIAPCTELNLSPNVGRRMPPAPPVATFTF